MLLDKIDVVLIAYLAGMATAVFIAILVIQFGDIEVK